MPKISISKTHDLSLDEAKTRVHALVGEVQSRFPNLISGVHWSHDGSSAKVDGRMFDGSFEVDARKVAVNLNLSILASPFRAAVEGHIQHALEQRFSIV
jgi:putative polyhydroxyalkanoic acid system protein